MLDEEWRPIAGFPGYEVSNYGRVMSYRGRVPLLRSLAKREGYPALALYADGKPRMRNVHQLVAVAFLGPPPPGQEVRHLDGDRANSRLENLRYGTRSENQKDAVQHGTHHWAKKTHCLRGHSYSGDNLYITPRGGRHCLSCRRLRRARLHLAG